MNGRGEHYIKALSQPLQSVLDNKNEVQSKDASSQVSERPLAKLLSLSAQTLPQSRPLLHKVLDKGHSESLHNVALNKDVLVQRTAMSNSNILRHLRQDTSLGSYLSLPAEDLQDTREGEEGERKEDGEEDQGSSLGSCMRIVRTLVLYVTNFSMGLSCGIVGPTLLDLQTVAGISSSAAASLFAWGGAGRILSSLVTGLTSDRYSQVLQLGLALLLLALGTFVLPWSHTYLLISLAMLIQGMAVGCLGSGIPSYCFKLWGSKAPSHVQALGFTMSMGFTIAPLLARPFLQPVVQTTSANHTMNATFQLDVPTPTESPAIPILDMEIKSETGVEDLEIFLSDIIHPWRMLNNSLGNSTRELLEVNTSLESSYSNETTDDANYPLRYLYSIPSILATVLGLVFFKFLARDGCAVKTSPAPSPTSKDPSKMAGKSDCRSTAPLVLLFSLYMFLTCGLELTHGGLVLTFVVEYLGWTKSQAAYITFAFWLSLGVGRGLGTFVVHLVKPEFILAINCSLTFLTLLVLTIGCDLHVMVVWVTSCSLGLALSTSLASALGLAYRYLNLTGRLTSLFISSAFMGMMALPSITGALFQSVYPKCFIFVQLSASVLMALVYMALRLYHHKFVASKHSSKEILVENI